MSKSTIVCIDLGTSKITAYVVHDGKGEKFELNGKSLLSSSIYYCNGAKYYDEANNYGLQHPNYYFSEIKLFCGSRMEDDFVQKRLNMKLVVKEGDRLEEYLPVIKEGEDGYVKFVVLENDEKVLKSPEELLTGLVNDLLHKIIEKYREISHLLLAYPPSFSDFQKASLFMIAQQSGVQHIDLIPETTAACVGFGYDAISEGKSVLCIDCGCGTTDFAVIKKENNYLVPVSTVGFSNLGGSNYTKKLFNYLVKDVNIEGKDISYLMQSAESTKIDLQVGRNTLYVNQFGVNKMVSTEILNSLYQKYNDIICDKLQECLNTEEGKNVCCVFLSGRGFNLKCLNNAVREVCERNGKTVAMKVDNAVAYGMALVANSIFSQHSSGDHCNPFLSMEEEEEEVNIRESLRGSIHSLSAFVDKTINIDEASYALFNKGDNEDENEELSSLAESLHQSNFDKIPDIPSQLSEEEGTAIQPVTNTETITISSSIPEFLFKPEENNNEEPTQSPPTQPTTKPTTTVKTTLVTTLSVVAVLGALLVSYLLK